MEFHKCSDFGYKLNIKNNTKLFSSFLSLLSLCPLPSPSSSCSFLLFLNSSALSHTRYIGTLLIFATFNFLFLSLRPLQDHRRSSSSRSQDSAEGQDGQVPEQFSGLLHGSSPVCEVGQDPFQLLSATGQSHPEGSPTQGACHEASMQLEETGVRAPGGSPPSVLDQSERVGYPAGLPTTNSQSHPETLTHTASPHPGGAEEEGDRSGARSRVPPTSKPKAELKLSRSLSKSDSDLLTCSPTEDATMGSRSESLSNCSIGKKRLEKSPSFASEWDEVRLCDVTESWAGRSPPQLPCAQLPGPGRGPGLPWFLGTAASVILTAVREASLK